MPILPLFPGLRQIFHVRDFVENLTHKKTCCQKYLGAGRGKQPQHCVKSIQIRSVFWSVFSCRRPKYENLITSSPYSTKIGENGDQKNVRIWKLFTQCKFATILSNNSPIKVAKFERGKLLFGS